MGKIIKAARNALKGYTYQNYIFTLLLAKMDTEREIVKIISEATDTKNFDDAYVELESGIKFRIQVKNYEGVRLKDIQVDSNNHIVSIKGNQNKYDSEDNNIFVIKADIKMACDDEWLGIPAIKMKDLLIVPLSEDLVADMIESMYQSTSRALQIIQTGYKLTSAGEFDVVIDMLPPIISISTDLNQKTVIVRGVPEDFPTGITHIEGKPGIGKSHYVSEIIDAYPNAIVYRFWIGAQDPELTSRLRFNVFLEQLGLLAFQSPKSFTIEELINQLCSINKLVVIDGLDHVENNNSIELDKYIDFLDKLQEKPIKVILLSRPMRTALTWQTTNLSTWTSDETGVYLAVAYPNIDYNAQIALYSVSKGYPIITYFLAEHYLKYGELNIEEPITSINDYYSELMKDVRTKSLLGVFAGNNSFFTKKELKSFLEPVLYDVLNEFICGYPYLFEIIENRISLVHDSFNTFMRLQEESHKWIIMVNKEVCDKIIDGNIEYMARLSSFHFEEADICSILRQYSDFDEFEKLMLSSVDYNSIFSFYDQLRGLLENRPNVLDIYQYYSFALIYQIVERNDLIGYEGLVFQILQYVHKNSDIVDQIFSSDIIWQVYLTCTDRPDSIKRYMKDTMYSDGQLSMAFDSINNEIEFFDCLEGESDAKGLLNDIELAEDDSLKQSELLQKYLVIIWIQRNTELPFFYEFKEYLENGNSILLYSSLQANYHVDPFWIEYIYQGARYRLHELGFFAEQNICRKENIISCIKDNAPKGSFNVASLILSVLRLANHENRNLDICNINYLWSMYAQRKDYSVNTIDVALRVFEKENLIDEKDSFDIICRLMKQSEKGIYHLLDSYINLKGPDFVKRLVDSGKISDSSNRIDIFNLNPEIINCIPKRIIKEHLSRFIRRYKRQEYIEGREIKGILQSKYAGLICDQLHSYNKKVVDGLDEEDIRKMTDAGIEYVGKTDSSKKEKKYIPFENGYISREDFDYIKANGLSAIECSRFTDGWYTCLPYVDMYELFDVAEVRDQYLSIIHQALFARVIRNEYIGNWNDIIGNIPAFLEKYCISVDWHKMFHIMLRFLDLSVIYYPDSVIDSYSAKQ